MVLSASCPLRPRATLCWREVAAETAPCHDVPNSTASEEEQVRGPGIGVPWGTSPEGCRAMPLAGAPTRPRGPRRAAGGHRGARGLCGLGTVTRSLPVPGIHAGQGGCSPPAVLPGKPPRAGGHCLGRGWGQQWVTADHPAPPLTPAPPQFSYGNSSHVECPHRPGEPRGQGAPGGVSTALPRDPSHPSSPRASREPPSLSGACRDRLERLGERLGAAAAPAPHLQRPRGLQCCPVPAPGRAVRARSPPLHRHTGEQHGAVGDAAGDPATLTLPLCVAAGGLCPGRAGAAAAGAGPGQLRAGKVTPALGGEGHPNLVPPHPAPSPGLALGRALCSEAAALS